MLLGRYGERMKVLIVGNAGYIGPVVGAHLRRVQPESKLIGYDTGFFAQCLTPSGVAPERVLDSQEWGDVRQFPVQLLAGVDAVVYLAAISNDPMGKRFERVTDEVNFKAGLEIAKTAKKSGCRSFVFASSCSIYGCAEEGLRSERDVLQPLTAYAQSKADMEEGLLPLADGSFIVSCLRFSTACGMSPRLRLDLVLNDFVASALATGRIEVLSDGSPWRPLIDVKDMARAIEWAVVRESGNGGAYLAVNVGSDERNYQIRDLAYAAAKALNGTEVSINENAQPDKRSYRVDFSLYRQLAPDHQPIVPLSQSVNELAQGLQAMSFSDIGFRQSHMIRLKVLEKAIERKILSDNLEWLQPRPF